MGQSVLRFSDAIARREAIWRLRTAEAERLLEPETILAVEFVGLTEAEQQAAIAGFPGGKRFVLAGTRPEPDMHG